MLYVGKPPRIAQLVDHWLVKPKVLGLIPSLVLIFLTWYNYLTLKPKQVLIVCYVSSTVLVLECGLFLQQAGLWEQLWTLLQLYLKLNLSLSEPNHFKVDVIIPEKQLSKSNFHINSVRLNFMQNEFKHKGKFKWLKINGFILKLFSYIFDNQYFICHS